MHDDQRTELPESFLIRCAEGASAPLVRVGASLQRPAERRPALRPAQLAELAQRHELCEDLANHLSGSAKALLHDDGLAEWDVLRRMHRGLSQPEAGLQPGEAGWITHRLAELLGWEVPDWC